MKTKLLVCLYLFFTTSIVQAGVTPTPNGVFVEGAIEGDGLGPIYSGDTIDYLTFEVTATGPVRLIGTDLYHYVFLAMGVVVGGGEPFDVPGFPYRLFNTPTVPQPELTFILNPGIYLVQIADEEYEDGDLGYYFLPVNSLGGGFYIPSPYSFTLEGSVQNVEFMEGNLDGTFTITHVPEPSVAVLLCTVLGSRLSRRLRPR